MECALFIVHKINHEHIDIRKIFFLHIMIIESIYMLD